MAAPSRNEILNRARKNVRRSYPGEPERVRQVAQGVVQAIDSGWSVVTRGTARIEGVSRWVIQLQAATTARPSLELARSLKQLGFYRLTNHTWAYPLVQVPE